MLVRVGVIAFNTYREAVRARVLHGLFALALATAGYALVVGAFATQSRARVVSDLGAASISLYAIVVALVLGSTSLYRELEHKTIFPILARPLRRAEYVVGKYLGTVLTLGVFVVADSGALLLALAEMAGQSSGKVSGVGLLITVVFIGLGWQFPRARTSLPILWAGCLIVSGFWFAAVAPEERRLVLSSALLTVGEVGIVAAFATVFAAFSSPFLTAVFTLGMFVVGRSADTLAHLPTRVFGEPIKRLGQILSKVVPNLMLYVPPRPILLGESAQVLLSAYLGLALVHAVAWVVVLLALASLIFRKRDFL